MDRTKLSTLKLIFSMVLFGTIGILRQSISLPSSVIALARSVIGFIFMMILIYSGKKKLSYGSVRRKLPLLCACGAMLGFNWVLLFEAYNLCGVACATLCNYTAPIMTVLLSPVFFKEKLGAKKTVCIFTALLGILLVSGLFFGDDAQTGTNFTLGIIFGMLSACLYCGLMIGNKKLSEVPSYERTAIEFLASAAVITPYVLLTEDLPSLDFSVKNVILLAVAGIVFTAIAYILFFGAIPRLPVQRTAMLSYIDPVVALLCSVLILHEDPSLPKMLGAVLIIGSSVVSECNFFPKKIQKS